MKINYQIDNIDLKILNILSKNAKMPYTEVAKRLGILHEQSIVSAVNVTQLSSVKKKNK